MMNRRKSIGLLFTLSAAVCLPLAAAEAVAPKAGAGWKIMQGAHGEVWLYEGTGDQIRAALFELARSAQAPLVFQSGNLASTRIAGHDVSLELRYRA